MLPKNKDIHMLSCHVLNNETEKKYVSFVIAQLLYKKILSVCHTQLLALRTLHTKQDTLVKQSIDFYNAIVYFFY